MTGVTVRILELIIHAIQTGLAIVMSPALRIAPTKRNAFVLQLTLLILALLTCDRCAGVDDLAWHDHRFMEILSRAELDRLAKNYATRQRNQATSPDSKAHWQRELAEMARIEMWFADGKDRSEILQHNLESSLAINGIQDPLLNFRLTLETGRMIEVESQAALVTAEAGNLYGKQRSSSLPSARARLKQLASEIERLEKTNREISGRGSSFNSQQKAEARDELRILIASIKCQHFHWLANSQPADLIQPLNDLNTELKDMVRSTRSDKSRTRLQVLLADLAARYLSEADYRLLVTPILSEGAAVRQNTLAEIQIRYQLRRREAETAERHLATRSPLTRLEKQNRFWLACEVCVGQIEQAKQLNDAAMIASARSRLDNLKSATSELETGAYADAARRCLQKAKRVLELGSDLATLIEQIDVSRQLGENEKALRQITIALNRLSTQEPHSARAALLLIATELNIDRQDWTAAINTGQLATTEFQRHDLFEKAAAADLLKCFAMAQVINKRPNGRSDYLDALQDHSQNFTESSTSAIATKWLLQLIANSDQGRAIEVALQRLKQTQDASERNQLVAKVDELFWKLLTSNDAKSAQQISLWFQEYQQVAADKNPELAADDHISIAIQLAVAPTPVSKMSLWQQKLMKLTTQKPDVRQEFRHQLLDFILNAKQSSVATTLHQQRQQILEQPIAQRGQAFYYLARVLEVSQTQNKIQPGDVFLARTIDQIAIGLLSSAKNRATVALELVPTVSITAAMTGDQDAMQQVINAVASKQTSQKELLELAPSLIRLSTPNRKQQTTITPQLKRVLFSFWQQLVTSQPAGSDLWLEGLIQMITLSSATEDISELNRQFQMANVLYPEWGSDERKTRATAILNSWNPIP